MSGRPCCGSLWFMITLVVLNLHQSFRSTQGGRLTVMKFPVLIPPPPSGMASNVTTIERTTKRFSSPSLDHSTSAIKGPLPGGSSPNKVTVLTVRAPPGKINATPRVPREGPPTGMSAFGPRSYNTTPFLSRNVMRSIVAVFSKSWLLNPKKAERI